MTKLPAVRIGYLRRAPASTHNPCESPSGPIKAMWNKLSKDGLIEIIDKKYRRTGAGDKAVSDFNEGLSSDAREVLLSIRNGAKNIASMKGVNVVIQSELAFIGNSGFSLTRWGNDLMPSVGDVGIFRKSGNKVRVNAIHNGKDGFELAVERVDGESAGKEMTIPARTFVHEDAWDRERSQ